MLDWSGTSARAQDPGKESGNTAKVPEVDTSLGDYTLVHIFTIVDGNEEQLDPAILTANFEASQNDSFAWGTTRSGRWHKSGEMIGSSAGRLSHLQTLTLRPFCWVCEVRNSRPVIGWPSFPG